MAANPPISPQRLARETPWWSRARIPPCPAAAPPARWARIRWRFPAPRRAPPSESAAAAVQAGHQPDLRVLGQRRRDRPQIARLHHDVAVVHQQQRVPRRRGQFRQHPDFGIRRCRGDDVQRDGQPGKLAPQPLDILERRIVRDRSRRRGFRIPDSPASACERMAS